MEKLSLKRKLLDACVASLTKTAEEARRVMEEAQNSAREYGAPKDRYDAYRNQMMARSEMFARQLEEARRELNTLELIDPDRELDEVAFGAVVKTRNQHLFISAAAGKIDIDGVCYRAISVKVPFFEVIKGLKAGDEFEFRGARNRIEDVF